MVCVLLVAPGMSWIRWGPVSSVVRYSTVFAWYSTQMTSCFPCFWSKRMCIDISIISMWSVENSSVMWFQSLWMVTFSALDNEDNSIFGNWMNITSSTCNKGPNIQEILPYSNHGFCISHLEKNRKTSPQK